MTIAGIRSVATPAGRCSSAEGMKWSALLCEWVLCSAGQWPRHRKHHNHRIPQCNHQVKHLHITLQVGGILKGRTLPKAHSN